VAELHVHNPDTFARLIREGDLGFCDAYLEGWWTSPDLQAFLDLLHAGNDELYDGFPGMGLVRAYERLRHWMNSNSKAQAKKNISYHYDLGNEFYGLWLGWFCGICCKGTWAACHGLNHIEGTVEICAGSH
jgi:cyclopropane-fatty-acyl-phospholipid synthase